MFLEISSKLSASTNCFQESIRNSADAILLNTPDSLVVSISRNTAMTEDEQNNSTVPTLTPRISRGQNFGIDGLDSLTFTYKVSEALTALLLSDALLEFLTFLFLFLFLFRFFQQVSWPLELIANLEAIKKYNRVAL